MTSLDM